MTTTDFVESKDHQLLMAMLDGLDWLKTTLGDDPTAWTWGSLHTLQFKSLIPGAAARDLSIPAVGDPAFPRHGDEHVVDRSDYGFGGPKYEWTFAYAGEGPAQRMVALLDAAGPKVQNALPGGNVWIPGTPHFSDEAELWRRNRTKAVAFLAEDVVSAAEERWDLLP